MYIIEGFEFETKEQALLAKKELEGIRYIKEQMELDDPDVVLRLYHKLIAQNVFETPIGLGFISELKDYLQSNPSISKEEIPVTSGERTDLQNTEIKQAVFVSEKEAEEAREARKEAIRVEKENIRRAKNMEKTSNAAFRENQMMREQSSKEYKQKKLIEKYRKNFHISLFFVIVFAVVIIGMFAIIMISDDNVNILNYENALIDRYEDWEEELEERQETIEKKEAELGIGAEE